MTAVRRLVVISGKGGTGKTSVVGAFAALAGGAVLADCDVDAANLHLILEPRLGEAHDFSGRTRAIIDPAACRACGRCATVCPAEALRLAGERVSATSVMAELEKDEAFYRTSNGGVTFSGGEPLGQPAFLGKLLRAAKKRGWHTAVDTCGHAPYEAFAGILPLVDLFLYDLKCVDPLRHQRLTGMDNALILENLARLSAVARSLAVRIPLVSEANDASDELERMAAFCSALPRSHPVHILPYHRGGKGKWGHLDRLDPLPGLRPPTAAKLNLAGKIFLSRQISVIAGG